MYIAYFQTLVWEGNYIFTFRSFIVTLVSRIKCVHYELTFELVPNYMQFQNCFVSLTPQGGNEPPRRYCKTWVTLGEGKASFRLLS